MYNNYKILEVTKENEQQYLPDIVELEETVLKKMEQEGKKGQLFITGEEGISEYIHSDSNHVMIAVTNSTINPTISATYITQGQIDFTYNDITKYFKCGEDYQKYVKSKYVGNEFEKAVREAFDFSVAGIISGLSLTNVTYKPVAAYGHFGRPELDLPWEKLDKKSDLQVCVIKILADAIYKKCKLK